MENEYNDYELELSTDMLEDLDEVEKTEPTVLPQEDTKSENKKGKRRIKIAVFVIIGMIISLIILVKVIGYITEYNNRPMVDTKTNSTNNEHIEVSKKENDEFRFENKPVDGENKDKTPTVPVYDGVVNTNATNNATNNTSNDTNKEDNRGTLYNVDTGKEVAVARDVNSNVVVEPEAKDTVVYPTKKGMTVITNSAHDVSEVSTKKGSSKGGTVNTNGGSSTVEDNVKGNNYEAYLTNVDLLNAYKLGISPEEYYNRYILGKDSNSYDNIGGVGNKKNLSYKEHQVGIQATESFDEYDIKEGSYIPVVIASEVRSDSPGMFQAIVREDVYDSLNHRYTLIPKGSKILGVYDGLRDKSSKYIDMKVSRIILPNGKSLRLGGFDITNLQGVKGGEGYKDERYGEKILKSTMTLALGLVSDFVGNSSIGVNGFSIGSKNYDYTLKELKVEDKKKEDVTREKVEESYNISLSDVNSAMSELNKAPLSREFKDSLNRGYTEVVSSNRGVQENMLAYLLAQFIENKIRSAINGDKDKDSSGNNNGGTNTGTTNSGNRGNGGDYSSLDMDILSKLLNGGNSGNGNGLNDLAGLSKLLKQDKKEDARDVLGTNNIIKDVKNTFTNVKSAWDSVVPIIYIEGGTRLNLYVSSDISLEPYYDGK